nr:WecB/TagA/CpsF family glycosyltransferase [uncultured Desulfobacter sp.]
MNLWVDDCDMERAIKRIVEFVDKGDRVHTVFASNPEKNYSVPKNPFLYSMFKEADLLIPDGVGMVLAANWLHKTSVKRVPGCELMQNFCSLSADKGYRIFLYGAKEAVNKAAEEELRRRHPTLRIAGRQNGYLSDNKMEELINRINESRAQILFLALGSPKQELWIAKNRDRLKHVRVCQGIGGTLDVLAGAVKRAPEFYCKTGLEWFYRLVEEPARIKRQIKLPLFAAQVVMKKVMG